MVELIPVSRGLNLHLAFKYGRGRSHPLHTDSPLMHDAYGVGSFGSPPANYSAAIFSHFCLFDCRTEHAWASPVASPPISLDFFLYYPQPTAHISLCHSTCTIFFMATKSSCIK